MTPSAMKAIEDALPARPDVPVYIVPKDVMDGVAGFNIHRGCLAAGERPPRADWRACVARARRAVVLERVGDADNVGAIFRSAAAFGADAVLIGPACADPLYRKAIRTSMGAALMLPFADADPWPAMLADLTADGWAVAALTPAPDAMPLRDFASATRPQRVAIVLGHEGEGLTEAALAACDLSGAHPDPRVGGFSECRDRRGHRPVRTQLIQRRLRRRRHRRELGRSRLSSPAAARRRTEGPRHQLPPPAWRTGGDDAVHVRRARAANSIRGDVRQRRTWPADSQRARTARHRHQPLHWFAMRRTAMR